MKRILLFVSGIGIVGFSAAFMTKINLGLAPYDASALSLSLLAGIQVGTMNTCLNFIFVFMQSLFTKRFSFNQIVQILIAILLGILVNYFYYGWLSDLQLNSYLVRMLWFVIIECFCAFGVFLTLVSNVASFPVESLCAVLIKKYPMPFGKMRQRVDIGLIALILMLVVFFQGVMTLREGTIIGLIIFGPLLILYDQKLAQYFQ